MERDESKKVLLILDLDETLIYATNDRLERTADFIVYGYHIYKRPNLSEFINEVGKYFKLAVWSSASDDYVKEVTSKLFGKENQLEFIWGRSRCTYRRNYQLEEERYYSSNPGNHYNYVKPLRKLKRKGYDLNQVLIVDDTPHKCQDNYGNAIYPKAYEGDVYDTELWLLSEYLKNLKEEKNLRTIEKRNWRDRVIKENFGSWKKLIQKRAKPGNCICETPPIKYYNYIYCLLGIDKINGRFGEVELLKCHHCQRIWLRYFVEYESISRSGRWYMGILIGKEDEKITVETAVNVLEKMDWYLYGGSFFHTLGKRGKGKLQIDA